MNPYEPSHIKIDTSVKQFKFFDAIARVVFYGSAFCLPLIVSSISFSENIFYCFCFICCTLGSSMFFVSWETHQAISNINVINLLIWGVFFLIEFMLANNTNFTSIIRENLNPNFTRNMPIVIAFVINGTTGFTFIIRRLLDYH